MKAFILLSVLLFSLNLQAKSAPNYQFKCAGTAVNILENIFQIHGNKYDEVDLSTQQYQHILDQMGEYYPSVGAMEMYIGHPENKGELQAVAHQLIFRKSDCKVLNIRFLAN